MFRNAAIVYDEGGSDAAGFSVLFVVVDLDGSDAAPVRQRDRVTVADEGARASVTTAISPPAMSMRRKRDTTGQFIGLADAFDSLRGYDSR